MNADRLLAVVELLRAEIAQGSSVYEQLNTLAVALANDQSAAAEELKGEILEILAKAPSNFLPPSWRSIVVEIGGGKIVGDGLATRLQALLGDYRLSKKEAAKLVEGIHDELITLNGNLNNYNSFARRIGIEPQLLTRGQCELGVLYPQFGVLSDLESLPQEIEDLDTALRPFMEIGGTSGSPTLKQLSSSDFSFFFDVLPSVGAAFAKALDRILDLLKKKHEIDVLRKQIEHKEIDPEAAKLLKSRAQKVEEEGLERGAEAVIEIYTGSDEGRRNELKISVKKALSFILVQTQRGVIFEVTGSSETSEGSEIESAAKSGGISSLEARNLTLVRELGGSMKELVAKRDQLLLPYRAAGEEEVTSSVNRRKPRDRGAAG